MATAAQTTVTTKPAAPAQNTEPKDEDFEQEFDRLQAQSDLANGVTTTPEDDDKGGDGDDQVTKPVSTDKTDKTDKAVATTTTVPAQAQTRSTPETKTAEELWEGLSDAQKEALKQIENRAITAEERANRHIGQVGGLQRKINELIQTQQTAKPAQTQPTPAQVTAAMEDENLWKQLEEDFPSITAGLKKIIAVRDDQIRKQVEQTVQAATSPLLARHRQDDNDRERLFIEAQVRTLTEAHPDWQDVKESQEFMGWLDEQPPFVQQGIKSRNAADAVDILNRYKSATGQQTGADIQARRQTRVQQAAQTPGTSGRAVQQNRQQTIPDDFEAAWSVYDRQSARR